jgi:hypothetical protein
MTVLSKSKIKVKDARRLYYNKFSYKVHLRAKELYYANGAKDLAQFRQKIDELVQEQPAHTFYDHHRRIIDLNKIDYETVENYLNFRDKYDNDRNLVTFRRECDSVFIYSNDLNIIHEVLEFSPDAKVTQVVAMPSGVIYFKQEPPAAYRIYCKNSIQSGSIRQELIDYLERTPDMVPNAALERSLRRTWPKMHFYSGQYFNYNDDRNTLMMHLMFPELLGKSYKLEKK